MSIIRNAVLKQRKTDTTIEILYPTTHIDLVQGVGTVGKQLLTTSYENATDAVFLVNNNILRTVTVQQLPEQLGVAPATHNHNTSQIKDGSLTLANILAKKVPLDDGNKIENKYLPAWVFGGMRYKGNISGVVNLNNTWLTTNGITASDITAQGYYFIATNTVTLTIEGNPITIHYGDDGVATTGNQILETGDWLVFRKYENSKYVFDIVNNTYATATKDNYGTVKLANSSISSRAGLNSTGSNAVTEGVLKKVLRETILTDLDGQAAAIANASVGDLLFVTFENATELSAILNS